MSVQFTLVALLFSDSSILLNIAIFISILRWAVFHHMDMMEYTTLCLFILSWLIFWLFSVCCYYETRGYQVQVIISLFFFFRGEHKHSSPLLQLCCQVFHIWGNCRCQDIPWKTTLEIIVSPLPVIMPAFLIITPKLDSPGPGPQSLLTPTEGPGSQECCIQCWNSHRVPSSWL